MNDAGRTFTQRRWGTTAYLVDGDLELVAATDGTKHSELPSLDHPQEKYWTDLSDHVVKTMVRRLRAGYKGLSKRNAQRSIRGIMTADKGTLSPEALVHLNRIKMRFAATALSEKMCAKPPKRGPHGMATNNLLPNALSRVQRPFRLVGEREAAIYSGTSRGLRLPWLARTECGRMEQPRLCCAQGGGRQVAHGG